MANPSLVSPKQVARAIGVSESSLKRWCDQGLIETHRTAGGHRKMEVSEVVRFLRERDQKLVAPELLGLPPASEQAPLGLTRGKYRLVDALLAGDELVSRQIVFDLYLAKHPLAVIFDEVIATSFHEIGDRWACQDADVYQERRACETVSRILSELRRFQRDPESQWLAAGGTVEGDFYALPTEMAELVLRDAGFLTSSLGCSIPFASLARAVEALQPELFWLSVSYIRDEAEFQTGFAQIAHSCEQNDTALIVGGRAWTEEIRQKATYTAYGDTMQNLAAFAKTLGRSLHRGVKGVRRNRSRKGSVSKPFRAKEPKNAAKSR